MEPYYEDAKAGIVIYHGDNLEVLPMLDDLEVDSVLTDPPFGIVNQFGMAVGNGTRRLQFDWDHAKTTDLVIDAIGLALSRCKKSSGVFVFCGADQFGRVLEVVREKQYTAKPAAWVKECPPPAGLGNWWPSAMEFAVYGYRNSPYFGDDDPKRSNVFYADSYRHGKPGKVNHPTQKPLGLIQRLVKALVPPGGLVLDCFGGSGTTARAAKDLGRRCVLIEREEKYCEIAAGRLAQEVLF